MLLSTVRVDTLRRSAIVGILNPSSRYFQRLVLDGAECELVKQNRRPLHQPALTESRLLVR